MSSDSWSQRELTEQVDQDSAEGAGCAAFPESAEHPEHSVAVVAELAGVRSIALGLDDDLLGPILDLGISGEHGNSLQNGQSSLVHAAVLVGPKGLHLGDRTVVVRGDLGSCGGELDVLVDASMLRAVPSVDVAAVLLYAVASSGRQYQRTGHPIAHVLIATDETAIDQPLNSLLSLGVCGCWTSSHRGVVSDELGPVRDLPAGAGAEPA